MKRLRWTSVGQWWLAWVSGATTTRCHTLRATASTRRHGPRALAAIISEWGRCSCLSSRTSIQADHVSCIMRRIAQECSSLDRGAANCIDKILYYNTGRPYDTTILPRDTSVHTLHLYFDHHGTLVCQTADKIFSIQFAVPRRSELDSWAIPFLEILSQLCSYV